MRQADARIAKIDAELESFRAAELGKCKDDARGNSHHMLDEERLRIEHEAGQRVSVRRNKLRRQLYERRSQLTDELFSQARERLSAFAAGPDYAAYLRRKAGAAAGLRRSGEEVVLQVRAEDLRYEKELIQACGAPCRVEAAGAIALGGLLVSLPGSGRAADETLDSALEAQRQWFYETSELFLGPGGDQL
nr:V-type ATP synthase subunit E family protein [Dysosmobacter acutus]